MFAGRRSPKRRPGTFVAVAFLVLMVWGAAAVAAAAPAGPPAAPDKVPVLIVDSGIGDVTYLSSHWLGQPTDVSAQGAVRLLTSPSPAWWHGVGGPDTYVLTASDASGSVAAAPVGVGEIAWALDRIAERHPSGRTVLVASGAAGLQARAYLEDLGTVKQSERADAVGVVLIGTPNGGTELAKQYPMLDLWAPVASSVGLKPDDLMPDSGFISALNAGRFPVVVHSLVVEGTAVELAGMNTDGISVLESSALATAVATGPSNTTRFRATASEAWPLGKSWQVATPDGGASTVPVDAKQVALLQTVPSYLLNPDVASAIKRYYQVNFSTGAPTTHLSTRLVMDISGSMADKFGAGTKLDASKRAASDFTKALAARTAMSGAIPEDLGLITFNESGQVAAAPGSSPSTVLGAIAELSSAHHTNIGSAIETAVRSFDTSPRGADRFVVLLSDGIETVGLDSSAIMNGPVADAIKNRVHISTIRLGGGSGAEADTPFLRSIAEKTGGTFYKANDVFELRRDFLRARYSSLGTLFIDTQADPAKSAEVSLGRLDDTTELLEVGVLADAGAPTWTLMRDGAAIPADQLTLNTSADGVTSLALAKPQPGVYSLKLADKSSATKVNVFAVKQVNAFVLRTTTANPDNTATLLLIGVGVLGGVAVVSTVALGATSKRRRAVKIDEAPETLADGELGEDQ